MTAVVVKDECEEFDAYHTTEAVRQSELQALPRFVALKFKPRHVRACDSPTCDDCAYLRDLFRFWELQLLLLADGKVGKLTHEPMQRSYGEARDPGRSDVLFELRNFSARYVQATSHLRRLLVIADLKFAVDRWKVGADAPAEGDEEWERRVAQDIRPNAMLIEIYGVTERQIARLRKKHGFSRPRGRTRAAEAVTIADYRALQPAA